MDVDDDKLNASGDREVTCELSVTSEASGSALFTLGSTSAIASVYGPLQPRFSRHEDFESVSIEVTFTLIGDQHQDQGTVNRVERDAEAYLKEILLASIVTSRHPRTLLVIRVAVLRDDGCATSVALNACALALVDAGISMYYVPIGVNYAFGCKTIEDELKIIQKEEDADIFSPTTCGWLHPSAIQESIAKSQILIVVRPKVEIAPNPFPASDAALVGFKCRGLITDLQLAQAIAGAVRSVRVIADLHRRLCTTVRS